MISSGLGSQGLNKQPLRTDYHQESQHLRSCNTLPNPPQQGNIWPSWQSDLCEPHTLVLLEHSHREGDTIAAPLQGHRPFLGASSPQALGNPSIFSYPSFVGSLGFTDTLSSEEHEEGVCSLNQEREM